MAIRRNDPFKRIGSANVKRSSHNLSHSKIFDGDMGYLYPVLCEDVIPGDHFKIGLNLLIRFQPLVHPTLHEINAYYHIFFVPYRLLSDDFEDFITMGVTGDYEGTLTPWRASAYTPQKGTLWDFLLSGGVGVNVPAESMPNAFPKQAYNFIYNSNYRDENYIEPVDLMQENILRCAWEKDYFTSAQPEQQRGTSPAFRLSQNMPVGFYDSNGIFWQVDSNRMANTIAPFDLTAQPNNSLNANYGGSNYNPGITIAPSTIPEGYYNHFTTNVSRSSIFNINDLRLATQIQMWMERNERGGIRYTEFLRSHFNVAPRDERLDRPEYIGGAKVPIIVSEVLQTSGTQTSAGSQTSPQGNLAGHGIAGANKFCGKYNVKEFGLIMGILSIRPRTVYSQGIDRQWLKKTPFDFVFPEFTHLSEQGIKQQEIYVNTTKAANDQIFAFIPRYDEYRYRRNTIANNMRDYFKTWQMSRIFTSNPQLNESFISMDATKRIFAVETEPGLVINVGNVIIANRPIPIMGEPGRLDHS